MPEKIYQGHSCISFENFAFTTPKGCMSRKDALLVLEIGYPISNNAPTKLFIRLVFGGCLGVLLMMLLVVVTITTLLLFALIASCVDVRQHQSWL